MASFLLFSTVQTQVVVADSSDNIELVIATIERQENELGGVELNYVHEVALSMGAGVALSTGSEPQTRLYQRECIDRSSRRLETTGNMNVSSPDDKYEQTTVASSGRQKRFRRLESRGEIHGQVYFPTDYLAVVYGVSEGFAALLKNERIRIEATEKTMNGRQYVQLTWTDESNTDVTCTLDPTHFYQPIEFIRETPNQPSDYPDGRERTFSRTEILDFWKSDNAALPSRVRVTVESVLGDGKRLKICEIKIVVTRVKRNVRFDSTEFDIVFPKGTLVTDAEQQIYYREGDPDSIKKLSYSATTITSNPVTPQAVRSFWTSSWPYLIVGSLIAITAGLVLKNRNAV
ncbi:MAG: hypothetical protein WCH39_21935 [Schlesneria sp.]